jgi:pyruvate dehydrogenase E1 component alpha subunit
MADPESYRERDEVDEHRPRDPIPLFRDRLLKEEVATQDDFDGIEAEVRKIVEDAVTFADESPFPDPEDLGKYVYADPTPGLDD